MPRITEAIGCDVEVSEPNGKPVRGYIMARWVDERQPDFDRWYEAEKAKWQAEAWERGLNTGIGYKAALDIIGVNAPEPENPYRGED